MIAEHINSLEDEDELNEETAIGIVGKQIIDDVDDISINCMMSEGEGKSPAHRHEPEGKYAPPLSIGVVLFRTRGKQQL